MRLGAERSRRIGPIGTASRAALGLTLLAVAYFDQASGLIGGIELSELVLGLVVFPGIMVVVGLLARQLSRGPLRATSPGWYTANLVVIVALFATPYTAGAAALFYGATLLVASSVGQGGCEVTVVSNLILRRDDQVGCPAFGAVDAVEARRGASGQADGERGG